MKIRKNHLPQLGFAALFALSTASAQVVVEQWDFNDASLAATSGGQDLQYADDLAQAGTFFGSTTSFGIPDIGGTAAAVAKINGFTLPSAISMPVSPSSNGSGSLVNEWTIIMDVLFPTGSDKKWRALLESDGGLTPDADLFVNNNNGFGIDTVYGGNVTPNAWHRLAFVVDNDNDKIRKYVDGQFVGSQAANGVDGRWALAPGGIAALFADNDGEVAPVFVNSIQFRDAALNTGQIQALGSATSVGIPETLPPAPAFIESSVPDAGAIGVVVQPDIQVILNSGDSTVAPSSVKLLFDDALVAANVTPDAGTFTLEYTVPSALDPNSKHRIGVAYQENGTLKTNSFIFSVANYQKVALTTPIYLETFDSVEEGGLPAGWIATNHTDVDIEGDDIDNLSSDTYRDWVVVSQERLNGLKSRIFKQPPISLNGAFIENLGTGNMLYAESDSRSGNQVQVLFTGDYDLTGKSNIFVAFNSLYEQNQDNIDALEYSIDQGQTWEPLLYMLTQFNDTSDVLFKADGSIDAVATLNAPQDNSAYTQPYGAYIEAPITDALAPFISGRYNDEADLPAGQIYSKRIEVLRAAKADGQPKVRFRFVQAATASWYWGIDNFGIYQINTPVITGGPKAQTVSAGSNVTLEVTASGAGALKYQWMLEGLPILNATNATLTLSNISAGDEGDYSVTVSNSDGPVTSLSAHLTVIVAPQITAQPQNVLVSAGSPINLSVEAMGQQPFSFQWQKDGSNIPGANSATFGFPSAAASNTGAYHVIVSNSSGTATSADAHVAVSDSAITNGLVVHLNFDGSPGDSSGRANDASLVGNPTFKTGLVGQAIEVITLKDGSQMDYASLGYPEDLKFGESNDFSISIWINYTASEDDPPLISNKNWASSGNVGWGIFSQGGGNLRVNVTGSGGANTSTSATPNFRDGNWHNMVLTVWRGRQTLVFADGQLVQTIGPTSGTVDTDEQGYAINIGQDGTGQYTDNGSSQLVALIDDVGIWRRAITPQEASSIYAHGLQKEDLTKANGAAVAAGDVEITGIQRTGGNLEFSISAAGTFQLQKKASLNETAWTNVGAASSTGNFSVPTDGQAGFFRVMRQ